jgi:hydroxyacylglutathione hydrolase
MEPYKAKYFRSEGKGMADIHIHTLKLGPCRCYLIQGDKTVMIDGGSPERAKDFLRALDKLSLRPDEIKLIVLTDGHWDRIGSVKIIKNITGAKVALHREEREWLENPIKPAPPAVTVWGRFFAGVEKIFFPVIDIPAAKVDIVLEDRAFPLADYGIPGRILPTPGNFRGSVSVLLETGDVFVGDLAMNAWPLRLFPSLPIFDEDMQQVRESWKLLLSEGAKTVYPAQGRPFSADVIRKALRL